LTIEIALEPFLLTRGGFLMDISVYLEGFVKEVVRRYEGVAIPHRFNLDEIGTVLKEKYLAVEEPVSFADLDGESMSRAKRYYVITDPNVLQELYTPAEKMDLYSMMLLMQDEPEEFEFIVQQMWHDIQLGKRINIILESEDNIYMSNFHLQGMSDKLLNEMYILNGIDEKDCHLDNEAFRDYLKILIAAGFITI